MRILRPRFIAGLALTDSFLEDFLPCQAGCRLLLAHRKDHWSLRPLRVAKALAHCKECLCPCKPLSLVLL